MYAGVSWFANEKTLWFYYRVKRERGGGRKIAVARYVYVER